MAYLILFWFKKNCYIRGAWNTGRIPGKHVAKQGAVKIGPVIAPKGYIRNKIYHIGSIIIIDVI